MSLSKKGMPVKIITLGLSLHRPEMVPFLANWMQHSDAVLLEEPTTEGFEQMSLCLKLTFKVSMFIICIKYMRSLFEQFIADLATRPAEPAMPQYACRTKELCL
jgi:hypothetical protein